MSSGMVPGTGQSRGWLDRESAQRDELDQLADTVDQGSGSIITPTSGSTWSKRGRMVRLPDFNMAGPGSINVQQYGYQYANAGVTDPTSLTYGTPAQITVLSYTVPNNMALRLTHLMIQPANPGYIGMVSTTVQVSGDTASGLFDMNTIGNSSNGLMPVSILIAGGKTVFLIGYNYSAASVLFLGEIRGYLFTDAGCV